MSSVFLNTNSSSSSSSSSSSLLRIPGLASGLDTDSIVKSMLTSYQTKIDKANQQEQLVQWKQSAYRDIIKGIKDLQNYFDPLSSKYIMGSNSMNINTTTSDTTSVATATAGASAKAGTYEVNVTQLAQQAKITGSSKDSLVAVTDLTKWSGQTLNFGANGSITLSNMADTTLNSTNMSNLAADINAKIAASGTLNGKISASYVNDGSNSYIKFTNLSSSSITLTQAGTTVSEVTSDVPINTGISSSSLLTDLGFKNDGVNPINFTLTNGTSTSTVSLNVTSTSTVKDLINAVNSATNGAITMNIDDNTGNMSFQSKSYGSSSNISISNINATNNILTQLGISTTTGAGKDAIVAVKEPGQSAYTTTTQSSNNFTINGVSYSAVSIGAANITVAANTDNVVTNIKNFITDYNTIISTINTKLTEKKDNNYQPLTDSQKSSMSDSQITAWETKAKVGILHNDDYLNQLMTQLRSVFSAPVYSSYDSSNTSTGKISLSFGQYGTNAIGIDTSSKIADAGQLVIKDETKLRSAIQNNFDDFKKLFTGSSSAKLGTNESYVGSEKYNEDGLFKRMDTILRDYVSDPGIGTDGTYSLSGTMNIFVNKQYDYSATGSAGHNTLPDQVYSQTLSISKLKTQMSDAQTRYYNQFTQLETALTQLNSQQSSLSSMLGTG